MGRFLAIVLALVAVGLAINHFLEGARVEQADAENLSATEADGPALFAAGTDADGLPQQPTAATELAAASAPEPPAATPD